MSHDRSPDEIEYLTAADAGRVIDLTPAGIRAAVKRGQLHAAIETPSGLRLFVRSDLLAFRSMFPRRRRR